MDANEERIKLLLSNYNILLLKSETITSEIETLSEQYADFIGLPKMDVLLDDLRSYRDKAIMKAVRIETAITSVEDEQARMLLEQRYLAGATWEEIADSIGYSLSYVHRLHKKALRMISVDMLTADKVA